MLLPGSAHAQRVEDNEAPLVTAVRFSGEPFFPDEQLGLYVRTHPNRRLLGIPGATWWRWLYQFGSETLGGGAVGRVFTSTGEPPAYLDSTVVVNDVEQLRLFYEREGFRSATVDARITPADGDNRVHVEFEIHSGIPTFIRTFRYNGLDALTAGEKNRIRSESLLLPDSDPSPLPLVLQPDNRRYSEPLLLQEGRRVLTLLRDMGYADVGRESIHAVVYPIRPDSFDVTMDIVLGLRYRFGDVSIQVEGPDTTAVVRADSIFLESSTDSIRGGTLRATFTDEPTMDFELLRRTLQFRPGDPFNQSRLIATKRRLDATGVFAFTDILEPVADSSGRGALPRLDHHLVLQSRVRHQVRFETFMLQRSGALADTDNELGTGAGVTYSNLNLFGGGEAFRVRTTGSIAADIGGLGGFTSAQWEIGATLSYPYLTFPFGSLDRLSTLYDARSQLSVSLLAARRDALRLVLRGRGGAAYRFELRHNESLTSLLDLVDITVSNPDTLAGFKESFLDDVLDAVDDQVQRAQIIEDYTRPQFNNALRYTLRSLTTDPFRRASGHSYEGAIEVGGNMGYLLDRFVFTPSELEGSLPGLGFFAGGRDARMIYRQYVRLSMDLRRYIPIGRRSVLAYKVIAGAAHPVANADVIPFDRRFYSGGASSVRAWRLRELGPGAATFISSTDSLVAEGTNILGGEIKLEGSIELRATAIPSLFGARWIIGLFVDAGNVWLGPRNPGSSDGRFRFNTFAGEMGVGTGFGLRLAWDYLIVRLDAAYKVHDPRRQGDLLPDKFNDPVLQFGIGHTF